MATKTSEQIEAAIARWQTRLRRAVRAIEKLEKQKKRLAKKLASDPAIAPPLATAVKPKPPAVTPSPPPGAAACTIDTSIPAFLQRKPLDPVAAEIKAEQEATKRTKAQGRIAKMKAKARGDLKRMPLSGKAALEAIRNG